MTKNIFNREKLKINRDNAINYINKSLFFKHAAKDIIARLNSVDKDFSNIIDLGCRTGNLTKLLTKQYPYARIIAADMSESMLQSFDHDHKLLIDEEKLEFSNNTFDLITFSLGLHWINDVQNFLAQIQHILKPDGIFIANFIGGNSLQRLRMRLIAAEIESKHTHTFHISPFIAFEHITSLLEQAGFAETIVDYENIKLEYKNPLELMQEVKNIGEANILIKSSHYAISKQMMSILANDTSNFCDQINIISFIASPNKNSIKLKL